MYPMEQTDTILFCSIAALGNLGSVLSAQGKYEEAKTVLLQALTYRPNMADVHFNL